MKESQLKRATEMFNDFAGETVKVDEIASNIYVYGSELACLRIFAKYQAFGSATNSKTRIGYSTNLETWYFTISK